MLGQGVQRLPARDPCSNCLIAWFPFRQISSPVVRKPTAYYLLKFRSFAREGFPICFERLLPLLLSLGAFFNPSAKLIDGVFRQIELVHSGPSKRLFRSLQLLFAERITVRRE